MIVCLCDNVSLTDPPRCNWLWGSVRRDPLAFNAGCRETIPHICHWSSSAVKAPCTLTDLHQTQALQSVLDQFLYLPFLGLILVLAE